jgi:hypothetical protein
MTITEAGVDVNFRLQSLLGHMSEVGIFGAHSQYIQQMRIIE